MAQGLVVSDKKIFSCFPYIDLFKTCNPEAGPFLAQAVKLNKLGRGPPGDATYLVFLDKKIFSHFPYISPYKICYLWGGAIFGTSDPQL